MSQTEQNFQASLNVAKKLLTANGWNRHGP